jgi:four helix bundle protein
MSEKQFQDIKIRCYKYSLQVIKFVDSIEIKRIFYSLVDQFLRSATSIGANLIEATSAHSKKDFIKFYEIALKSSNEVKYWICLLRDGFEFDKEQIKVLLNEVDEISKIIGSIVVKLKDIKSNVIKERYVKYGSNSIDDSISSFKIFYNSDNDEN